MGEPTGRPSHIVTSSPSPSPGRDDDDSGWREGWQAPQIRMELGGVTPRPLAMPATAPTRCTRRNTLLWKTHSASQIQASRVLPDSGKRAIEIRQAL